MMADDFARVVLGAVQPVAQRLDFCEHRATSQIDPGVAGRVAGQAAMIDNDPIDLDRALGPQIINLELEAHLMPVECLDFAQTSDARDGVEIAVAVRRIGDDYAAAALQRAIDVIQRRANPCPVRNRTVCMVAVRFPELANEIGLEQNEIARANDRTEWIPARRIDIWRVA